MEKKFDKCPVCGSGERLFGNLTKELRDKGFARPEWDACYDMKSGAMVDPQKQAIVKIGEEVPSFMFKTDICLKCGAIYCIEVHLDKVKKTLPIVLANQEPALNRAQRRHLLSS